MNNAQCTLPEQYVAALENYLAGSGEAPLHQAYELGRKALTDGLGVLDLAMLHHRALRAVAITDVSAAKPSRYDKAAEFFAESLSPFEMSLRGYRESNARLLGMNAALQQAKATAEAANRELEAFSYSVAHDLRTPLRGIDGFSRILLEDYADILDGQGREYLAYLCTSAQQMAELIDGLLELSRVTRSEVRRESIDLSSLAREAIANLRKVEPDRRVEVVIQDGITAAVDARLTKIAIENLLGNAWKFTGKRAEARIEFSARMSDGLATYLVRDNGAGFDMAYAAKLFGAFQRLHAASEYPGTGIGLATVQRIVNRHNGRIWAEGEIERGAAFYFTLGSVKSSGSFKP